MSNHLLTRDEPPILASILNQPLNCMFNHIRKVISTALVVLPLCSMAMQNGVAVSYGTGFGTLSDPQGVGGFNLAYQVQPDSWVWGGLNLWLNFSYGYWKTTDYPEHQTINTFAVAPILRWYFCNNATATPFIQGSIGATDLSQHYFGNRNLGSHFAFQDQGGVGFAFGAKKEVYLSLEMLHYSNAGLASQNSGFTVPALLTVGAWF